MEREIASRCNAEHLIAISNAPTEISSVDHPGEPAQQGPVKERGGQASYPEQSSKQELKVLLATGDHCPSWLSKETFPNGEMKR